MDAAKKKPLKIVAIGIGSRSYGRKTLADVLSNEDLRAFDVTLMMVDTNGPALERMYGLGLRMKDYLDSPVVLERSTDRAAALPGADYVITSVARRRYELWEQDFRVPLAHGFRHVLGENGGPGALFHALRSYGLILPICADIERLCPDALMLNFTNPEARVLTAILHLTQVRALGLCHGVTAARNKIAEILERAIGELDVVSGGMNHFYWVLKISDRASGDDLYPELKRRVSEAPDLLPPLVRYALDVYGYLTYPSDDHMGEYLGWASGFTGVKWKYGRECKKVMPEEAPAPGKIEPYLSGEKPVDDWVCEPSVEEAVPILCDIERDRAAWRPAVNLLNTEGYVENLPRDAVVEVPAVFDAAGVHPQPIGPLPEALAAFTRTQLSIQKLLVQAWREKSRALLLQALLLDPVVTDAREAESMLDALLELQSEFIPAFT